MPWAPNAHKNLGVALAGLGNHLEAAHTWKHATMVYPPDPRSLQLLYGLVQEHPEVLDEPEILSFLRKWGCLPEEAGESGEE